MLPRRGLNFTRNIRNPSKRVNFFDQHEKKPTFSSISEEELQKLEERNHKKESPFKFSDNLSSSDKAVYETNSLESLSTTKKKAHPSKIQDMLIQYPLVEPLTTDNQFERLKDAVIPLHKFSYQKQMKIKQQHAETILKNLRRALKEVKAPLSTLWNQLPCPLESVIPSPDLIAYRNKDEFSVHMGVDGNPKTVGYFVGLPTDPLMRCIPPSPLFNIKDIHKDVAIHFQNFIRKSSYKTCFKFSEGGTWRNIVVRSNLKGELMAIIIIYPGDLSVASKEELKQSLKEYFFNGPGAECCLTSLYIQTCSHSKCTREMSPFELIEGKPYLVETCLGRNFQISPDSFFQTNTLSAELLYDSIEKIAELSTLSTLLDICCGTGIISILLGSKCRGTIGIDAVSGSIQDAKVNARNNDVNNVNFICSKIEKILPVLSKDLENSSNVVAVLNPSRAAVHPSVIETIRECEAIQKLIFVTCKPEGNAMKNMAMLCSTLKPSHWRSSIKGTDTSSKIKGRLGDPFSLRYAIPVDLFPHTAHLEFIFLFERISM